ncbi:hypothetical protein HK097_007934 [Rhizophlyctis rosea]|uniref:Methyltransferase domain-containing protein n=1 Tax=Rhizophlyctis rosea TaxID=64517 RepID=A0AAD5X1C4_9FUNG|nr:hypothetical protein HK097_007934 [Rhizophlyctis rosea]
MDLLPDDNERYGTQEYWEERYQKEGEQCFDWFKDFNALVQPLEQIIPDRSARILHLGCGNSRLSEDMYKAGWRNMVNLDFSPAVIENMRSRTSSMPEMSWIVGDIFHLDQVFTTPTDHFDVAIDKGTLDALLTKKHDPWDPDVELVAQMQQYMEQVRDVLKPNGVFLHITFAQPHFRRRFLEVEGMSVEVQTLGGADTFEYFVYVARKTQ